MTEYQRKQRERPTLDEVLRKQNAEPLNKKLKRNSSIEPLEDRGSPLPDLPGDLREKQDLFDLVAERNKSFSQSPLPTKPDGLGVVMQRSSAKYVNGVLKDKKQSVEDIISNGMIDPLQIIELIRERQDIGFLYMSAAVPRSSIEYNPYNLKYVYAFIDF